MLRTVFLIAFVLIELPAASQTIRSALDLNEAMDYKARRPAKIVEKDTFYYESGREINSSIKVFDDAGMLATEERYNDEAKLIARFTYTNDTVNQLKLSRSYEKWNQFGYSKETAFYVYNVSHFLVRVVEREGNGNTIRDSKLTCNEKGHPISLFLYDGNGGYYGKELATYLYDRNKLVRTFVDNSDRIVSSDTVKISLKNASLFPGSDETYNAYGDPLSWTTRKYNGRESTYEAEYNYDGFGNCTDEIIYKVVIKRNGSTKRKTDKIFRKEFTYH